MHEQEVTRDIPIIFSAPMVLALLAGRKTMTRRLAWRTRWNYGGHISDGAGGQMDYVEPHEERVGPTPWKKVLPGDRLWVKENWNIATDPQTKEVYPIYRATDDLHPALKWRSSMYMPRRHSRITLSVTAVRTERLQTITEADAIAEGIEPEDREGYPRGWKSYEHYPDGKPHPHAIAPNKSAVTSFRELWQWLHGHETWAQNPEVVCMTFEVHQKNIDVVIEAAAHAEANRQLILEKAS